MTLREAKHAGDLLVWDAQRVESPGAEIFDAGWWRERDALLGESQGRGMAYVVRGLGARPWVLRHNRRGGALGRVNPDLFLFTGRRRARPLRELRLLAGLHEQGLPVPAPVAARAQPRFGCYRGDLITERVEDSETLADRLARAPLPSTAWRDLGAVLARFHRAGVWHADLNARNVLVDANDRFYLIDLDNARLRSVGKWREANLKRLQRSLEKFRGQQMGFNYLDAHWAALHGGYLSAFAAGR